MVAAFRSDPVGRLVIVHRFYIVLFVLALAGCASTPTPLALTDPAPGAVELPVLVVTTRQRSEDTMLGFAGARHDGLQFADATVLIPPEREPGEIRYPNHSFNPKRDFTTGRFVAGKTRAELIADLNARLAAQPDHAKVAFVFVHGFNTDFAEGLFLHAQITHDFGAPGVPVSFSWASAGLPPAYLYDRESMQLARDGLAETLRIVAASDATEVALMGHSMGGALVMETLRQLSLQGDSATLRRLGIVALASPDIDAQLFKQQHDAIDPRPRDIVMFVSRRDRALRVSARLRGGATRVGTGSDVSALTAREITVIDLTEVGGRADAHTRFANSPFVINMIRNATAVRSSLEGGPDEPLETVAQDLFDVGTSLGDVIRLPD